MRTISLFSLKVYNTIYTREESVMKFRCLKLLLVVSSLALSGCSLFNKKSSSENTSSEEKRPPRENFFERIPYYEVKSGVKR